MDRLKGEKLKFITNDEKTQLLLQKIPLIANTGISVLISGESGTGKEIIANCIHASSERVKNNFVAINCAAFPPDLLESELFGYKKGSFTGATQDHRGLFETADGGTIFLDEIGDMPLNLQSKLLRIIQEKKIRPIGGLSCVEVDFRIVSATHKSLKREIKEGRFREDLYYRLGGVILTISALRERIQDIPELISSFSKRFADKYRLRRLEFSSTAIDRMMTYSWPGNVRQLENLVEQLTVIYQDKKTIEAEDLFFEEDKADMFENKENFICSNRDMPTLVELSDRYIRYVYRKVNQHQGDAAKVLGLSRRTIYRKLQEYNNSDQFSDFFELDKDKIGNLGRLSSSAKSYDLHQ
jgi:transcriptional regulator with PAS, ATPase and Fis domain